MLTFLYNDPKDYVVEIDEQTPEPDADFPDAEVLRYMSPLQGLSTPPGLSRNDELTEIQGNRQIVLYLMPAVLQLQTLQPPTLSLNTSA